MSLTLPVSGPEWTYLEPGLSRGAHGHLPGEIGQNSFPIAGHDEA